MMKMHSQIILTLLVITMNQYCCDTAYIHFSLNVFYGSLLDIPFWNDQIIYTSIVKIHSIFFLFDSWNTQNIQIVTPFLALLVLKMVWEIIMVLQMISMFKTLNKFKVLWLKVVSINSNPNLVLVTTKLALFSKIIWFFYILSKL